MVVTALPAVLGGMMMRVVATRVRSSSASLPASPFPPVRWCRDVARLWRGGRMRRSNRLVSSGHGR
jgi:hypothetical protein